MDHIPRLSEAVYLGLCHKIGSPTEVRIRREVMDIEEAAMKPLCIMRGFDRKKSGSRREGFRLRTSDTDFMLWPPDHMVICDLSQISLYHISQHTVILMECDDLPPGFSKLNLLTSSFNAVVRSSCINKNNEIYIFSTLFRDNFLQFIRNKNAYFASSIPHGPCSSNIKENSLEFDFVFCLRSHHWPTLALPWIQRCRQQGWPSESVILKIFSGGFHVVPIGSTPDKREEWRISFSEAEENLVYSMNHCQFLCYGLLKIFLKEVINSQNNNSVLCSYFMKTIIFWVIQNNNSSSWKPDNLLSYFWKCFKLLIYWVKMGECPNFFIPKNNMFRVKVNGSVQIELFSQLYYLYLKGIPCLLLSPTIRTYLRKVILYRSLSVCIDESSIISSTDLDISLFQELQQLETDCSFEEFVVYINQILKLMKKRLTPYEAATLQIKTSLILRNTALLMQKSMYLNKNRTISRKTRKVSALLKLSCTIGFVSEILYLAMYLYRTRRYERSISCLQKAQERMSVPFVVYGKTNINSYEHYTAGMSLYNKLRRAVVFDISLDNEYTFINELVFEQKVSNRDGEGLLHIPPLVMLHMLFILNHHRLGDTVRSQQSLQDLQTLLLYDDGINVPNVFRDISWHILGICQQITGDYFGSLQSYQYSLQQHPFHNIQEATLLRMNTHLQGSI